MDTSGKKCQAVVLIHGIGEQHPIKTLRDFVESLAGQLKVKHHEQPDAVVFWDKPDPASGNYETRRMTMKGGRDHPVTDFYEFYWAHHMRDTNFSHIRDWLGRVVLRRPNGVSPRLKPVFFFLWVLVLGLVAAFIAVGFKAGFDNVSARVTAYSTSVIGTIVLAKLSYYLFFYLGDAARYLDPAPGNIGERQAIRSEGIALLKNLHQSGKYQRIIVVSHSLGSAIAYDLVKLLWNDYYKKYDPALYYETFKTDKAKFDDVYASEKAAKALMDILNNPPNDNDPKKQQQEQVDKLNDFYAAQRDSFNYLKSIGNDWLITDLVTIGSPLAHAGYLFAQEDKLFEKLVDQREYPTCPPHFQKPDTSNVVTSGNFTIQGESHPFTLRHFNHSSPFSVVNWTNIFYSSDFVGGPLNPLFGSGIRDISKTIKNPLFMYPAGHTRYWDHNYKNNILPELWGILFNKHPANDKKAKAQEQPASATDAK